MSKSSSSTSGGTGFIGVLTIVFVVLKLVGIIDWSWWWVVSPIWISLLCTIPLVVLLVILYANEK